MTGEGRKAVRKKVERIDKERREFVHAYHGGDLDDPTQFHLVLNTSRLGFARCARIIAELLIDQG
jgi:cytidylate kinase